VRNFEKRLLQVPILNPFAYADQRALSLCLKNFSGATPISIQHQDINAHHPASRATILPDQALCPACSVIIKPDSLEMPSAPASLRLMRCITVPTIRIGGISVTPGSPAILPAFAAASEEDEDHAEEQQDHRR
jgi:hypothetical protein